MCIAGLAEGPLGTMERGQRLCLLVLRRQVGLDLRLVDLALVLFVAGQLWRFLTCCEAALVTVLTPPSSHVRSSSPIWAAYAPRVLCVPIALC